MHNDDDTNLFHSIMIFIVVFVVLPILFMLFTDPNAFSKLFNPESTRQQQETRRETQGSFYCNRCNKRVGGYRIREWESENGRGFYIVTEFLDCGHIQHGN